MTWELIPDSSGPSRGSSGRSPGQHTRGPWWWLITVGVIVGIAGVGLLVWPWVTAKWLLAVLLGAAITANGLALIVRSGRRSSAGSTVGGLLLIGLGLLVIVFAETAVAILVSFMGVLFAMLGGIWLLTVLMMGGGARPVLWIPPAIILGAGIAASVWPGVALVVVAVIAGFFTLLVGVTLVWSGVRLKRVMHLRSDGA